MKENLFKGLKVGRPPLLAGPSLRDLTVSHLSQNSIQATGKKSGEETKEGTGQEGEEEEEEATLSFAPLTPPNNISLCCSCYRARKQNWQTGKPADRLAG